MGIELSAQFVELARDLDSSLHGSVSVPSLCNQPVDVFQ
jgi:hypothetical protein